MFQKLSHKKFPLSISSNQCSGRIGHVLSSTPEYGEKYYSQSKAAIFLNTLYKHIRLNGLLSKTLFANFLFFGKEMVTILESVSQI